MNSHRGLVYDCAQSVCKLLNYEITDLTKHENKHVRLMLRNTTRDMVVVRFDELTVSEYFMKKTEDDPRYKIRYVSGLVSNWIRKDVRYGCKKYESYGILNGEIGKDIPKDGPILRPGQMRPKTIEEKPVSTLNPDGKSRACSCGARFTTFPNHHMRYCDMWVRR